MIVSALTAGAPRDTWKASGVSTLPPALASSELNQTTVPSYCAPWISIRCGLPALASWIESLIISSHVVGGLGTRSERYHSNWVVLLEGTAQAFRCPRAAR